MLDGRFVILGAAIGSLGTLAYLRDTLRGTTQPNRVTWLLWALAPLIAFSAELGSGVGLQSLMTFVVGFGPLLIFIASFHRRSAPWRIGPLDWLCGTMSLCGLVLWLVTLHGSIAISVSIFADALAAAPTLRKSFLSPGSETGSAYAAAAVNAGITLLTVKTFTTAEAAFPIYIATIASVETVLITGRIGPRLMARRKGSAPTALVSTSDPP